MTEVLPLIPVSHQVFQVTLGGQRCTIRVYEKKTYVRTIPLDGAVLQTEVNLETILVEDGNPIYCFEAGQLIQDDPAVYIDLLVNDQRVITGVIALHGVGIVQNLYLGFVGELVFYDTVAQQDPLASGLGTRWFLTYTS